MTIGMKYLLNVITFQMSLLVDHNLLERVGYVYFIALVSPEFSLVPSTQ